jgi:hypothetical protein
MATKLEKAVEIVSYYQQDGNHIDCGTFGKIIERLVGNKHNALSDALALIENELVQEKSKVAGYCIYVLTGCQLPNSFQIKK